jgi:hypothetical protein
MLVTLECSRNFNGAVLRVARLPGSATKNLLPSHAGADHGGTARERSSCGAQSQPSHLHPRLLKTMGSKPPGQQWQPSLLNSSTPGKA